METKLINGTKITFNKDNENDLALAERIGSEFVFLALLNKTHHLDKQVLDSISTKLNELIEHEDGERRKHERKITMTSHLGIITNKFLNYLNQESGLRDEQVHSILNETIFCIVQPAIKYGHGIIFKNGYLLNKETVFEVTDKENPSYLKYLEKPKDKHWCKPQVNKFFLSDINTIALSQQKISQEDLLNYLKDDSAQASNSFISLKILDL